MAKLREKQRAAELETKARGAVKGVLSDVSFLRVQETRRAPNDKDPDFEFAISWPGGDGSLVCEVRSSGQPALARDALARLASVVATRPGGVGVLIAPYISERVAAMCADQRIGTVDLSGNARLSFGNVFIQRTGNPNRFSETREMRSIFAPKASRILRVLLERPRESWQVQALAKEAGVSLGQASTVKRSLTEMEWLGPGRGVRLADPENALRKWAEASNRVASARLECYTSEALERVDKRIAKTLAEAQRRYAFSGQAAAWRWAPMAKPARLSLYIDDELAGWTKKLILKPVSSGGNVVLFRPRDSGVFYCSTIREGVSVTGAVQTYIDCVKSAGRGEEAAEAVLEQRLRPTW